MVVGANSTRTIWVPFTADSLAYARAHSPVTVYVTAYAGLTTCQDVPQWGGCDRIVLNTPDSGQLQVSAT